LSRLAIYCADIGSVKRGNFAWARIINKSERTSDNIRELVSVIARDLSAGLKVALGFECPLFVPIAEDPINLTSARIGEGSRAWSAGAGCGSLATGLTETTWILEKLIEHIKVPAFLGWEEFKKADAGLFIWEAFVSVKPVSTVRNQNIYDALVAARTFDKKRLDEPFESQITCKNARSLIGAALLQTGWSDQVSVLSQQCIVVKGEFNAY
jgi:hypothetical protein